MFSVLDGHGAEGHYVSNFSKLQLVDEFEKHLKAQNRLSSKSLVYRGSRNASVGRNIDTEMSKKANKVTSSIEVSSLAPRLDTNSELNERPNRENFKKKSLSKSRSRIIASPNAQFSSESIKEALRQAFLSTHKKLNLQNFDSKGSGTTCVAAVIYNNKVYIANAGDSRI